MAQVRPGEMAAGEAITIFFDGPKIGFASAGLDAEAAFAGEGSAVAGDARRQDAIEHIDAASHQFDELGGRAQAHRIARLLGRKKRFGYFDRAKHFWFGLPD